jgi:hypothetical protein
LKYTYKPANVEGLHNIATRFTPQRLPHQFFIAMPSHHAGFGLRRQQQHSFQNIPSATNTMAATITPDIAMNMTIPRSTLTTSAVGS